MQAKITQRLHDFWDAGIRGPDFVWAATGPALEAYSEHPVVKKSNEPGKVLSVSEFLRHVRRMVVDFVVGRVLSHNGGADAVSGLDDVTTYYLLHRYDFGLESAPIGPCILYAVSCWQRRTSDTRKHQQPCSVARRHACLPPRFDGIIIRTPISQEMSVRRSRSIVGANPCGRPGAGTERIVVTLRQIIAKIY